jgi:ketosteroid isomerase-like protein
MKRVIINDLCIKLHGGSDSNRKMSVCRGEDGMTAFDGEAFVDRFNIVWDSHDIDGIAEMFTEDVVFEASFGPQPYGERAVGVEAARRLAAAVFERIPDLRFREIRHFVSPAFAVVESVTTGTPVGGAPYEVHLVDLLTIRDGKIAAKRSYRKARL